MTVLRALARGSVEAPTTPLTSETLVEWIGGGPVRSGAKVTEERVLGLPTYWTGVRLVASSLAQVPIHVFARGTRQRLDESIYAPTLEQPNESQTSFEFWQTMHIAGQNWGNEYAFKAYDSRGRVVELWFIHPSRVTPAFDPDPSNPTRKRFLVELDNGQYEWFTPRDIFHLPYMAVDGRSGVRPLHILRETLGIAIAGDESAADFYGNGAQISGVLESKQSLTNKQADALKARWQSKVAGPTNRSKIAVLDADTHFVAVGMKPSDAQLLESRKWAVSDLARVIGLPPHLVGDVEKSTSWGTGIEQQNIGVVVYLFSGWMVALQQRVTLDLVVGGRRMGRTPPTAYAEASLQAFMRGDAKTRSAFYQRGIADGWLSRNEVRDLENLEPQEGLDEFLVPSNLTLISVDGELVPLSSKGVEDAAESA